MNLETIISVNRTSRYRLGSVKNTTSTEDTLRPKAVCQRFVHRMVGASYAARWAAKYWNVKYAPSQYLRNRIFSLVADSRAESMHHILPSSEVSDL